MDKGAFKMLNHLNKIAYYQEMVYAALISIDHDDPNYFDNHPTTEMRAVDAIDSYETSRMELQLNYLNLIIDTLTEQGVEHAS